ncbi:MAG: hypothetical protein IT384_18285 [Deltaproteobacteria bacterium]|nr:hypothetical protein [Deltaproteobacteria bacterium]
MSVVHLGLKKNVVLNTGVDAQASQLHEIARALNTFCHSERMNRPAQEKDIQRLNHLLSGLEDAAKYVGSNPELIGNSGHQALVKALGENGRFLEAYVNHRVAPWMKHFAEENREKSTFGKLKDVPTLLSMKKAVERLKNLDSTAGTILGAQVGLPTAKDGTKRLHEVDLDAFLRTAPSLTRPASSPMPPSMESLFLPMGSQEPVASSLDPRLMDALRDALMLLPAASPLALAIRQALGPVAALQGDAALPSSLVDPAYHAERLREPARSRHAPAQGTVTPASYEEAKQELAARVRAGKAGPVYETVNDELEQRIRAGMQQHRTGGEYLHVRALIAPSAQNLGGGFWGAEGPISLTPQPDSMAYIGGRGPYRLTDLQNIEVIEPSSKGRSEKSGRATRPQRVTVADRTPAGKVAHPGSLGIPREKIPRAAYERAAELGWKLEPMTPGMTRRKDAVDENGRFPPEWDDLSIDRKIKLANSICMSLEGDGAVVREVQTVRVRRFLFPKTWDDPAKEGRPQIMAPAEADAAWADKMRARDRNRQKA